MLRSGRLSLGPDARPLRGGLRRLAGRHRAVAVSSGTAALHLAVRAHGWGPGDEVVTSPLSFVASANCMLFEGAEPVFCDIDPRTLNMDAQAAEAACGERTAGLLPVHIFGYPADMPTLEEIARARGLGIVEDACEALGAVDATGVRVGTRGNPGRIRLLRQQAARDGRGRHAHERRRRGARAGAQRAKPGSRQRHGLALARPPRLQLPDVRRDGGDRRRAGGAPRRPAGRAGAGGRRCTASAWPRSRGWSSPARTPAPSAAAGSSTWSSCRRRWTATA